MRPSSNLPAVIERYFTVRLMTERNVSANTIACYRDTFQQLFTFAQEKLRKQPSTLSFDDLDAPFISTFLADLETKRGVSVRTRNVRLTAIRSFFRFAAYEEPDHSAMIQRVLAIPNKRHDKREVDFLVRSEIQAILATPNRATWLGRRDYTLLLLAAPDRFAPVRADRPRQGSRPPGHRCACAMRWKGSKGAMHAANRACARRSPGMA